MAFKRKDVATSSNVQVSGETDVDHVPEERQRARRSSVSSSVGKIGESSGGEQSAGDSITAQQKRKNSIILVVVVGVIIVLAIMLASRGEEQTDTPQVEQPSTEEVPELTAEELLSKQLEEQGYGINSTIDSYGDNQSQVSSDYFVKDLDGNSIPEMFDVKAISYVSDMVTYVKHRSITGEGVELYWLEGKYKGKSCRVAMPYKYYREIPDEGAVICSIEVVQTTDGNLLATYFQFDPEAYDSLARNVRRK